MRCCNQRRLHAGQNFGNRAKIIFAAIRKVKDAKINYDARLPLHEIHAKCKEIQPP